MAVALKQESPGRAMALLRAMLAAPRTWGSAIGTKSSLAAHAARRGVRGVVMSLRPDGAAARGRSDDGSSRRDRNGHAAARTPYPRDDPAAAW